MKKFLALIMSIALMAMMFAAPAFAADSVTISVAPSGSGDQNATNETYYGYKIFDVIKKAGVNGNNADSTLGAGGAEGYNYTISTSSPWYSTIQGMTTYFTLIDNPSDATTKTVTLKTGVDNTEATAKAIAAVLKTHVTLPAQTPAGTIAPDFTLQSPLSKTDATAGYYLITSSAGSNLVLATTNIAITEKNAYPSTTKTVADGVIEIGDNAEYTITVRVPSTVTHDIVVHESMDNRLLYTANSFTVTSPTGAATAITKANITESTITNNDTTHLRTWTWTLAQTALEGLFSATERAATTPTYKDVVINFTAKLLDTAVYDVDYGNTEYITYSNYETAPTTPVNVKTYDFDLEKTDGTNTLAGAQFELRYTADAPATAIYFTKSGTTYTKIDGENGATEGTKTIDVGTAKITGLDDAQSYFLVETKAPEGYNMLNKAIEVKIAADGTVSIQTGSDANGSVASNKITVVNNAGILMPSTGSAMSLIMYIVAGALVLAACGYFFVAKRRNSAE